MICIKKLSINSAELDIVRAIYESSFPIDERRDFESIVALMSDNVCFQLEAIYSGNEVVGMLSSWQLDEWRYVEHFAIDATKRGGGIGREVLREYIERNDTPVVLEVEPPADVYSRRRIAFYVSMGFVLHKDYRYVQPSYGEGREAVELLLMTCGAASGCNLDALSRLLHARVYGVK